MLPIGLVAPGQVWRAKIDLYWQGQLIIHAQDKVLIKDVGKRAVGILLLDGDETCATHAEFIEYFLPIPDDSPEI